MRKDMSKVIVERPRVGGKSVRKGREPRDYDDYPQKESMSRRGPKRGYNGKDLNENLSPLQRFMEKQVGRPWNKVFSEICENIKVTSTVQQHVRDHVKWMVETKGLKKDGKKVLRHSRYSRSTDYMELRFGELYVDPDTGILCKYKLNKYTKTKNKDSMQSDLQRMLNENKSKFLVCEGYAYKLYPDHNKEYTVKHKATAHHAELDVKRLIGFYRSSINLDNLIQVFNKHRNRFSSDCPYFARLRELIMIKIKERDEADEDKIKDPIKAIKKLREEFGLSLADAKVAVEATRSWKKARKLAKELMDNLISTKDNR